MNENNSVPRQAIAEEKPVQMQRKPLNIIMIGPLPPPINGMTMANQMLFDGLIEKGIYKISTIDTSIKKKHGCGNLKEQGKFIFSKFTYSLWPIIKGSFSIICTRQLNTVYITTAQSEIGYLKYTPFIFAAKLRNVPCFIHIHGGFFGVMYSGSKGIKQRIIKKSLDTLSGVIVLGESLRRMFRGIVPDEKIFVCPNGVEEHIFASEEEVREKTKRWEKDETVRIIYLSNLMKDKGILDLFDAVTILKSKGTKVHLDIAGAIEPGIKDTVEAHLENLKTEATYHGVVTGENKKQLLLKNYIFCLPTYYPNEGQPISILEGMANGCAILTTDQGGIKDIVNENYGYFAEKQSPQNLADTLLLAFKKTATGLIAWKEARTSYSQKQFVERIEGVFLKKV